MVSGSYYPGHIYFFRGLCKNEYASGIKLHASAGKMAGAGLASSVAIADWNRDGRPDLIVGNIQGEVWFLPNELHDGELVFGAKQPVRAQGAQVKTDGDAGPLVADWDSDGIPDLLVGSSNGSVTFYRGIGSQGVPDLAEGVMLVAPAQRDESELIEQKIDPLTKETVMPPLDRPSSRTKLAVYDWNGDGKLDLIVGDEIGMTTPEPVLTADQRKEREDLERQQSVISKEISARFEGAEEQARRELGVKDRWDSESQQEVAEKADEILKRTSEYRDLYEKMKPLSERLAPLKKKYTTHGFVWVYLRK